MASKFGGIPIEQGSKFGGIPIDSAEAMGQQETPAQELPERPVTTMDRVREYRDKLANYIDTGADVAGTVASSLIAEPVAGLAGISDNYRQSEQSLNDPVGAIRAGNMFRQTTPIERAQTVDDTRNLVTAPPSTEGGKEAIQWAGDKINQSGFPQAMEEARKEAGDTYFDYTGSPMVGAAAATIPDALMLGLGGVGGSKSAKQISKTQRAPMERDVTKSLAAATPAGSALKAESERLFKDIDGMGVTVNRDAFASLIDRAEIEMKRKGGSQRVTTEAWGALEEMKATLKKIDEGEMVPIRELEELREIANVAADTPGQAKKQAVALSIVNEIDDFIESATPKEFNIPGGVNPNKVGVMYKKAREQWGRYRRSQMLDKAVVRAGDQASGFENGLRIQFRQILNSERKSKYFKDSELAAMRQVVNGTGGANLFKALGKAGVDFGGGNNALLAMVTGISTYGLSGDPLLAFSVVGASSVAKKLAERLTKANASLANQVVRAGNDARKITEVYIRNTPKAQRSADELSLLLLNGKVDLSPLKRFRMEAEAAELALQRRAQLAGITATGSASTEN